MKEEQVKKIEQITKDMGDLITAIEAKLPAEWDAVEKLTAAHKQLRSIEINGLVEHQYL